MDLLARLPGVRVLIEEAQVSDVFVTLNGKVLNSALVGVNTPVDPRTLKVKGVRDEDVVDATIRVAERRTQDVKLVFKAEAAPVAVAPPASTPDSEQPGLLPPAVSADASSGSGQPDTLLRRFRSRRRRPRRERDLRHHGGG